MPSLPTLPRRTRLEQASVALACFLVAIGIAGMGGWLRLNLLFSGPLGAQPMVPEEALCFLLFGLVLLAREWAWRSAEWLAVLPAALGLARIVESLFSREFRVDSLLLASAPSESAHAMRFAGMTAVCLALGGASLAWHPARRSAEVRQLAEAAIGSILAAIGWATLFGYGAGLAVITSWGTASAVPPATAAALLVLGIALLVLAWREKTRVSGQAPAWAPLPTVAGCLTLTLILWVGLREHEHVNLNARTLLEMETLAQAANSAIEHEAGSLQNIARNWSDSPARDAESWRGDAAGVVGDLGCESLAELDPSLRTRGGSRDLRWFGVRGDSAAAIGFDHGADPARLAAIDKARETGRAAISSTLNLLGEQAQGFAVYAPVRRDGGQPGFALAEFSYKRLFQGIAADQLKIAGDYHIVVSIIGNIIYETPTAAHGGAGVTLANTYVFNSFGQRLHIEFTPSDELVATARPLQEAALIAGILLSALMGLSVHLAMRARGGQRVAERSNMRLRAEIDERKRMEVQLKLAKTEAEAGSRAKSEFLASMSHEIRTPMNGVIGMASLLMETKLTAEQRDYINTIRASGDALLTIINEILDFSKIESGKMEIEHHPFELAPCVEETLDLFGVQAAAKRLELACHVEPDVPPWIVGDVTRLRQVIANLVNNAIKFTPSGSVTVDVKRGVIPPPEIKPVVPAKPSAPIEREMRGDDDDEDEAEAEAPAAPAAATAHLDPARNPNLMALEFSIRDTGIGIPPDRMDRLFKAFSQVDSSTTRKYGGTGLGLAICQRLCQLMGGAIRVESATGRGSAFIFTILTEEAPAVANSEALPPLPAPMRSAPVLCVEDLAVNQARLRTAFETWGARCVVVPDARAALAAALREPPSLLVVDDDGAADSPLSALASLACPRLVLFPFGQTPPAPPAGGPPFESLAKPLKVGLLMHAVAGLFGPRRHDSAAHPGEGGNRLLAEEFPLEVLLAEDNLVNQKVALRFLERLGYRADVANNGREALNLLELRRYDLVLMDMQMPEMDGLEASRQIRRRLARDRQPKILALTANAMKGDRELCLSAGMDDHISKPVKMEEIAAAIRRHFSRKTAAVERR